MKVRLLQSRMRIYKSQNQNFFEKINKKYTDNDAYFFGGVSLIFCLEKDGGVQEKKKELYRIKVLLQTLFYYWQYMFDKSHLCIHSYLLSKGLRLQLEDGLSHFTIKEKKAFQKEYEICCALLEGKVLTESKMQESRMFLEWQKQDSWEVQSIRLIKKQLNESAEKDSLIRKREIKQDFWIKRIENEALELKEFERRNLSHYQIRTALQKQKEEKLLRKTEWLIRKELENQTTSSQRRIQKEQNAEILHKGKHQEIPRETVSYRSFPYQMFENGETMHEDMHRELKHIIREYVQTGNTEKELIEKLETAVEKHFSDRLEEEALTALKSRISEIRNLAEKALSGDVRGRKEAFRPERKGNRQESGKKPERRSIHSYQIRTELQKQREERLLSETEGLMRKELENQTISHQRRIQEIENADKEPMELAWQWKEPRVRLYHKMTGTESEKTISVKPRIEEMPEIKMVTQAVKKETSVSKQYLRQQEIRIDGIQKELKAQRKMVEDAMVQFKAFTQKDVSVNDLTNQVMKEMHKQFRLEKVRRGF